MIDLHLVRDRHVEIARLQVDAGQRELAGTPQRAAFQVPILGSFGRGADAERRHQLVEEAVEMIRPEHHHQIGIEGAQRGGAGVELAEEFRVHVCLRLLDVGGHQRTVRAADQLNAHGRLPTPDLVQRAGREHVLDRERPDGEALLVGIARHLRHLRFGSTP